MATTHVAHVVGSSLTVLPARGASDGLLIVGEDIEETIDALVGGVEVGLLAADKVMRTNHLLRLIQDLTAQAGEQVLELQKEVAEKARLQKALR